MCCFVYAFTKIISNSGAYNYLSTKSGLIRVLWLFLLQSVPPEKFTKI